ncbi:WD40 repeat-like protein [Rickenella mellea]|uniref:WD40 repeat-like protein n=1 Tax=Rickenella mellea TaxID=50990 RepID=A0A4Y7Q7Z0_9AGAM|nr:WD40 repeat-like protein [Rickenella mellea]
MSKPGSSKTARISEPAAKRKRIVQDVTIPQDKSGTVGVQTTVFSGVTTSTRTGSPVDKDIPKEIPSKKGNQSAQNTASIKKKRLPTSFKIIAGSYEKLLYGIDGTFVDADGQPSSKPLLKPIFIFPAHVSCVKAVAASPDGGKWLATGSTDEIVKVWDLRRRKEIGGLIQHEGSITHLSFPSRSHLLSASEDGTICIFRARDWVLLRSLKGHKGRVNSVAVHPSGKVGLSVGKDRTLRMWDLMRGKGSASTKLGKEGEIVRWSSTGHRFIVQTQSTIDVYSTEMSLLQTLTHPSRIHDAKFCRRVDGGEELLLVAAEDKKVTIYSVDSDSDTSLPVVGELVGHTNRVKSVDTLDISSPCLTGQAEKSTTIVSTASSDGKIHVYDLSELSDGSASTEKVELHPVAEYDTKGTRLTCCTLADGEAVDSPTAEKRKRDSDDENDDGEDDVGDNESEEGGSDGGVDE